MAELIVKNWMVSPDPEQTKAWYARDLGLHAVILPCICSKSALQ